MAKRNQNNRNNPAPQPPAPTGNRVDADDDVRAILATLPDDLLKAGYLRAFKEGNPLLAAWWALRVIGSDMASGIYRTDFPTEIAKCFPAPRWPAVGQAPSSNCSQEEVECFAALYLHAAMGMDPDFSASNEVIAMRLP